MPCGLLPAVPSSSWSFSFFSPLLTQHIEYLSIRIKTLLPHRVRGRQRKPFPSPSIFACFSSSPDRPMITETEPPCRPSSCQSRPFLSLSLIIPTLRSLPKLHCLLLDGADGREPFGRGVVSDCCDAVLWIPETCWDDVDYGSRGWARHSQELLQVGILTSGQPHGTLLRENRGGAL